MNYTIKDVAREAGVSTATVSMVLSGKGKISEEKKAVVIAAINKLGYKRQRSSAKNTSTKKYIGLIVFCDFDFQWWFAKDFILSIKKRLVEKGLFTTLYYCDHDTDPQSLFDEVMAAELSGVLILHYNDHNLFSRFISQNIPLVLVNNNNYQSEFHTACADDYQGAYAGTKKMIEMGHSNFLFIDYNRPSQPATVIDRFFGFKKAIEEAGISFSEDHRIQVELDDSFTLVRELGRCLNDDKSITACFIHDDYFAVRVMKALDELGYRVPDDLSILAPGDTLPYDEPFIPAISTMQINRNAMGEHAANMMLSLMENPDQPIQVIKTIEQFVDRGSCI